MFHAVILLCVDPSSIGRLNYESMSQEAQLEMVVRDIDKKNRIEFSCDDGNIWDIQDWTGVQMTEDGQSVREISWYDLIEPYPEGHKYDNQGTIYMEWLPETVEVFLDLQQVV